jgi:hypothetical protein
MEGRSPFNLPSAYSQKSDSELSAKNAFARTDTTEKNEEMRKGLNLTHLTLYIFNNDLRLRIEFLERNSF